MSINPAAAPHHPLNLNVQLLYGPLGLVSGVAHWVNEEMMHVDTGRVILDHLSEVEITFPLQRNDHTAYHRVVAHVSRRIGGNTQLRIVRCSRDAHLALRELMTNCITA